jgi:hypothetical protein
MHPPALLVAKSDLDRHVSDAHTVHAANGASGKRQGVKKAMTTVAVKRIRYLLAALAALSIGVPVAAVPSAAAATSTVGSYGRTAVPSSTVTVSFGNYAGYSWYPLTGTDRYAVAKWKVPAVSCSKGPGASFAGRAAVWAGLWGNVTNSDLAQAGTNSRCFKNKAHVKPIPYCFGGGSTTSSYYAWAEAVPAPPCALMNVKPGNKMYVQVEYAGTCTTCKLRFWYDVTDLTTGIQKQGYLKYKTVQSLDSEATIAGVIVENNGTRNLPKFKTITISGLQIGASFSQGPNRYDYYMGTCPGNILAGPGGLQDDNSTFAVAWLNYTVPRCG